MIRGPLPVSPARVAELVDDVVRTGQAVDHSLDNAESLLAYALDETRLGDLAVRPMFQRSAYGQGGANVLFGAAQVQVPAELAGVLRDAVDHATSATTQLTDLRTRVHDWVTASDEVVDLAAVDAAIADALTGARRIQRVGSDLASLTPTTPGAVTAAGADIPLGETRRYLYFDVALDGNVEAARASTSYGAIRRLEPAHRGNPAWVVRDGYGHSDYPNPLQTPHFLGYYSDETSAALWSRSTDPLDAMPAPRMVRATLSSLPHNRSLHPSPYVHDWFEQVEATERLVALPSPRLDPADYPVRDTSAMRYLTDPDAVRAPFEQHLERTAEDELVATALRDRATDLEMAAARADRAIELTASGGDRFPERLVAEFDAAFTALAD
jgi:hypothetical protein